MLMFEHLHQLRFVWIEKFSCLFSIDKHAREMGDTTLILFVCLFVWMIQ